MLIDNYDSFTWNLVHLIGAEGYDVHVKRNDALTTKEAMAAKTDAIVLSPGPCTPDHAGICLELVSAAAVRNKPVFGVCLGLQAIAQSLGGRVILADKLMHGKISNISHTGKGFLAGLPNPFLATRYHSLVADEATLPDCFEICARSDDDGEIMAIQHKDKPLAAVQFHPESIASDAGALLFKGFMKWAAIRGDAMEQKNKQAI